MAPLPAKPVRLFSDEHDPCVRRLDVLCRRNEIGLLCKLCELLASHGVDVISAEIATEEEAWPEEGRVVSNTFVLHDGTPNRFADAAEWCEELEEFLSSSNDGSSAGQLRGMLTTVSRRLSVNPDLLSVGSFVETTVQDGVGGGRGGGSLGEQRYRLVLEGINQAGLLAYASLSLLRSGFNVTGATISTTAGHISDVFDLSTESPEAERELRSYLDIPARHDPEHPLPFHATSSDPNINAIVENWVVPLGSLDGGPKQAVLTGQGAVAAKGGDVVSGGGGVTGGASPLLVPVVRQLPTTEAMTLHFPNSDVYTGTCAKFEGGDKRHGFGTYVYSSINHESYSQYKGQWREDTKHGFGMLFYRNGGVFVGQWDNNMKHGLGVLFDSSGRRDDAQCAMPSRRYEGQWFQDEPHGLGVEETESLWVFGLFSHGEHCTGVRMNLATAGLAGCEVVEGHARMPLIDALEAEIQQRRRWADPDDLLPQGHPSSLTYPSAAQADAKARRSVASLVFSDDPAAPEIAPGGRTPEGGSRSPGGGGASARGCLAAAAAATAATAAAATAAAAPQSGGVAAAAAAAQQAGSVPLQGHKICGQPPRLASASAVLARAARAAAPGPAAAAAEAGAVSPAQQRAQSKEDTSPRQASGTWTLQLNELPPSAMGLQPDADHLHCRAMPAWYRAITAGSATPSIGPRAAPRPPIASPLLWSEDELAAFIACLGLGADVSERVQRKKLKGAAQLLETPTAELRRLGLVTPVERLVVRQSLKRLLDHDRWENNYAGQKKEQHLLRDSVLGDFLLPVEEVSVVGKISQGGYGTVYRGVLIPTVERAGLAPGRSHLVAVKEMKGERRVRLNELLKEACVMASLSHPNIAKFIGVSCDATARKHYIVSELMDCSLFDLIHQPYKLRWHGQLTVTLVTELAKGICAGVAFLHDRNVVHADLKSSNILIDYSSTWKLLPRICDFGHAAMRTFPRPHHRCGTPHWAAPEVLRSEALGPAADTYAFGVVLWEMLVQQLPHKGLSFAQVLASVGWAGYTPDLESLPDIPVELKMLVRHCLGFMPKGRPTIHEVQSSLRRVRREARLQALTMISGFLG